jgi:hypothetical protein
MHEVELLVQAEKKNGSWHAGLSGGDCVNDGGDIDLSKFDGPVKLHFHLVTPGVHFRKVTGATTHGHGAISIRHRDAAPAGADDLGAHFDETSRKSFAHVHLGESTRDENFGRRDSHLVVHNANEKGSGAFRYNLFFATDDGRESFALDPWIINS